MCLFIYLYVACFVLPQLGVSSANGGRLQVCSVVPNTVNEKSRTHPTRSDLSSWVLDV
jgi:hypothetical protein